MLIRVMLCFLGKVEGVSRGIAVMKPKRKENLLWQPYDVDTTVMLLPDEHLP